MLKPCGAPSAMSYAHADAACPMRQCHSSSLPWVQEYADDQAAFFRDFSSAYSRLMALGCPAHLQPSAATDMPVCAAPDASTEFRENAMHGSLERCRSWATMGACCMA